MKPKRIVPKPGQESVWDYPRPPRLEDFDGYINVVFNGITIAATQHAKRVLETSHPPVYYIPPNDIRMEHLTPAEAGSFCEWKGAARYYSLQVNERGVERAVWCYPSPTASFLPIKNYLAFYASQMDSCTIDGEQVIPQPGNFYGGWITKNIVGPFKGEPNTLGW